MGRFKSKTWTEVYLIKQDAKLYVSFKEFLIVYYYFYRLVNSVVKVSQKVLDQKKASLSLPLLEISDHVNVLHFQF